MEAADRSVGLLDVHNFKACELNGLSAKKIAALAEQMLCHISEQSQQIEQRDQRIAKRDRHIASQARDIKFKDVKPLFCMKTLHESKSIDR